MNNEDLEKLHQNKQFKRQSEKKCYEHLQFFKSETCKSNQKV